MKQKSLELDVDFIGGQEPMTHEEEKAISEFIRNYKLQNAEKQTHLKKSKTVKKILA
jgi:hypothetical protein